MYSTVPRDVSTMVDPAAVFVIFLRLSLDSSGRSKVRKAATNPLHVRLRFREYVAPRAAPGPGRTGVTPTA
jgi:hypothetical protein